jgi:hypothetical protein
MKPSTKKQGPLTQQQLAQKYRVDVRTIRRWQDLGAPLHDADATVGWIADRRSGTRYDDDTELVDAIDINPLRILVELAAADYLRHAMEYAAHPLVDLLQNEKGLSRKEANGVLVLLYLMLGEARKQWAAEAAYETMLNAFLGHSVDSLAKRIGLSLRGHSRPTNFGSVVPAGPKLTAVFEANGAGDLLKQAWQIVDPREEGTAPI